MLTFSLLQLQLDEAHVLNQRFPTVRNAPGADIALVADKDRTQQTAAFGRLQMDLLPMSHCPSHRMLRNLRYRCSQGVSFGPVFELLQHRQ